MSQIEPFSRQDLEEILNERRNNRVCRPVASEEVMSVMSRYANFTRSEIETSIRKAYKDFRESKNV